MELTDKDFKAIISKFEEIVNPVIETTIDAVEGAKEMIDINKDIIKQMRLMKDLMVKMSTWVEALDKQVQDNTQSIDIRWFFTYFIPFYIVL